MRRGRAREGGARRQGRPRTRDDGPRGGESVGKGPSSALPVRHWYSTAACTLDNPVFPVAAAGAQPRQQPPFRVWRPAGRLPAAATGVLSKNAAHNGGGRVHPHPPPVLRSRASVAAAGRHCRAPHAGRRPRQDTPQRRPPLRLPQRPPPTCRGTRHRACAPPASPGRCRHHRRCRWRYRRRGRPSRHRRDRGGRRRPRRAAAGAGGG